MATTWPAPNPWRPLAPGQIHVWSIDLQAPAEPELEALLGPDERQRAARFHFDKDRTAYIVTHGVLRRLLGKYLGKPAGEVKFCHGSHGKPGVEKTSGCLQFNLAHTRRLALIALSQDTELGVDVEWLGRPAKIMEIASRFFTAGEQEELAGLAEGERTAAFFRGWTRKEAVLKACGLGLSLAPESIEVGLLQEPARVRQTPSRLAPADRWVLFDLVPGPEHIGALAVVGPVAGVATWCYGRDQKV